MNEHVSENQPIAAPQLAEPHFDEEATLLSARPVVPLEEVENPGKRWFRLALVIILAGALGSATALLLYVGRSGSSQENLVVEEQPVEPAVVIEATPEPTPEVVAAVSEEAEPNPETSPEDVASETVKERPRVEIKPRRQPVEQPEEEDDPRTRDESWQETRRRRVEELREERRQQRREARREARRQQRRAMEGPAEYPEEMFRIREIFEGSPRPD